MWHGFKQKASKVLVVLRSSPKRRIGALGEIYVRLPTNFTLTAATSAATSTSAAAAAEPTTPHTGRSEAPTLLAAFTIPNRCLPVNSRLPPSCIFAYIYATSTVVLLVGKLHSNQQSKAKV